VRLTSLATILFVAAIGIMVYLPTLPAYGEPDLAPLAQATATNTPTSTSTPTPTFTPTATATRVPLERVFRPLGDPPTDFCARSVGDGTFAQCVTDPLSQRGYSTPGIIVATVGATPNTTPAVPTNLARTDLVCMNDSAVVLYLKPGGTPGMGSGIRLNAAGSAGVRYEWSARNGNLYTGPVYAVATQPATALMCVDGSN
jgi:hypothetical protein